MIKNLDIQRAIVLFKEWDNLHKWEKPHPLYINHTFKKAEDSLHTAMALFNLMTNQEINTKVLPNIDYNSSLWIINASYYSMFFMVQVLLAKENKKLPLGTKDTHKTTFLAFLYYYLIKNSGMEEQKIIRWEDIQKCRLSNALILYQQAFSESEKMLQIDRAKFAALSLQQEMDRRNELTYQSSKEIELSLAKISLERAKKFREIILEYLQTKN